VDRSITTSGTYTFPAGVTAQEVDLWGADGSGSGFKSNDKSADAGGSGSYVNCQLAISGPGPTTITVIVGQEVKHLHTVHLELLPLVEVEEVLLIVVILIVCTILCCINMT
jgi:hypothetical protein